MEKGTVYLLTEWGSTPERFKIGITRHNINNRIKSLQTGSSNEIVMISSYQSINYQKIERFLHKKYLEYSTDGGTEWFQLPSELAVNFIKECEKIDQTFQYMKEFNNPFIR